MSHPRSTLRQVVRAALAGAGDLSGATILRSWGQSIDTEALPAIGVFTPREIAQPADVETTARTTDVVVQLRREGGDTLEDVLDTDSAAIEAAVLPVLAAFGAGPHQLETTDIKITGEGRKRLGHLDMTFRVARFTPEGLQE